MINLLFNNDELGDSGIRRLLPLLASLAPVRLRIERVSKNQFVIRQPEA